MRLEQIDVEQHERQRSLEASHPLDLDVEARMNARRFVSPVRGIDRGQTLSLFDQRRHAQRPAQLPGDDFDDRFLLLVRLQATGEGETAEVTLRERDRVG